MSGHVWRSFLRQFTTLRGMSRDSALFATVRSSLLIYLVAPRRYSDDECEYRHVQLPKAMLKAIPKEYFDTSKGTLKLLWEDEWRSMGITQVCTRLTRPTIPRIVGTRQDYATY